ncbi:hypothetical protein [Tessaracoccus sp. OH4464_COT-324]|uniref:hypothetical protein n=1 Tax=Tessaracoccus sp. OH4464_COT-324 TaxID=2491059 RepID=UPI000F63D7A4|nr:hypothetical protein [Tessaracoccus sp. OH4464_COT-324]RRD45675.1 hypothetical protein EII42_10485 [Tessaracoccus sp. OH4464_COT-324]
MEAWDSSGRVGVSFDGSRVLSVILRGSSDSVEGSASLSSSVVEAFYRSLDSYQELFFAETVASDLREDLKNLLAELEEGGSFSAVNAEVKKSVDEAEEHVKVQPTEPQTLTCGIVTIYADSNVLTAIEIEDGFFRLGKGELERLIARALNLFLETIPVLPDELNRVPTRAEVGGLMDALLVELKEGGKS